MDIKDLLLDCGLDFAELMMRCYCQDYMKSIMNAFRKVM